MKDQPKKEPTVFVESNVKDGLPNGVSKFHYTDIGRLYFDIGTQNWYESPDHCEIKTIEYWLKELPLSELLKEHGGNGAKEHSSETIQKVIDSITHADRERSKEKLEAKQKEHGEKRFNPDKTALESYIKEYRQKGVDVEKCIHRYCKKKALSNHYCDYHQSYADPSQSLQSNDKKLEAIIKWITFQQVKDIDGDGFETGEHVVSAEALILFIQSLTAPNGREEGKH